MRKLLVGAGVLAGVALSVAACTPSQDISFTVDRKATIGVSGGMTSVRLGGYVWCTRPSVGIDIGVTITQGGVERSSSQTISCRETEPGRFASTVRFDGVGWPTAGPAEVWVQGSTDEDGGDADNDSQEFRGPLDLS